jgi:F-type H+-transporting ATPase subunit b
MELIKPAIGLVFWMIVTFAIIFLILKKYAWKPILGMIKEREEGIEKALKSADDALETMRELKSSNEKILAEARAEKDTILKEARDTKDAIINEAKAKAKVEGDRMVAQAREAIQTEKLAAITELKAQVATLSIDIAEKILKEQLSSEEKQKTLTSNLVKEVTLN